MSIRAATSMIPVCPCPSREVVLFDADVPEAARLAACRRPGVEAVFLRPAAGLVALAGALGRRPVDVLHVVSHGAPGALILGGQHVDVRTLAAEADALRALREALSPGAEILLYGCRTGHGRVGAEFLRALETALRARIAASAAPVGCPVTAASAGQEASWCLDVETAPGRAAIAFRPVVSSAWCHSLAAGVTATLTDSLVGDLDADGVADPGDTLLYTAVITNGDPTDITGVTFALALQDATLVANSINVSPIALDDAYATLGTLTVNAAGGLLANDIPDPGALGDTSATITAFDMTTSMGGTLSVNMADGSFTYTPPAGFTGTDTATYTLMDAGGLSDTATISVEVFNIWFIDNSAGTSGGAGTEADPFQSIADFNAANGMAGGPQPGDIVYIATGAQAYEGNLQLLDGQVIVGQGASTGFDVAAGIAVPPGTSLPATGGAAPVITNAAGDGVTLAEDNRFVGVDIGTVAGVGIENDGGTVGTLTIRDVAISTATGDAVNIGAGGDLDVVFDSVNAADAVSRGIDLVDVNGSVTVNGGAIGGSAAGAIRVVGAASGDLDIVLDGMTAATTDGTGADGVEIRSNGADVTLALDIDAVAGDGKAVSIDGATGSVTVTAFDLDTVGAAGATGGIVLSDLTFDADTAAAGIQQVADTAVAFGSATTRITDSAGLVNISGAAGDLSLGTVTGFGDGAGGFDIGGTGAGQFTFTTTGGTLDLINSNGAVALADLNAAVTLASVTSSGAAGQVAVGNATGALTISGGSLTSTGAGGDVVAVTGSATTTTIAADLTSNGAGSAVDITANTGGSVTLSGGIAHTGGADEGISVLNNTGGTFSFSGASQSINTSAGSEEGVLLSNNAGASVIFAPAAGGSGLDITTGAGAGFRAVAGGTVTVTGAGNSVTSGTGTALEVDGVTIGAAGLTFASLSSTGAVSGIVLSNTGSAGGLTVTGGGNTNLGGNASGGTIANSTGSGVVLTNTTDVSLTNLTVTNSATHGIHGTGVTNLDLLNSTVRDSGNAADEYGVFIENLLGTLGSGEDSLFSGLQVTNSEDDNVRIVNDRATNAPGGAADQLTVTGSAFTQSTSGGQAGLLVEIGRTSGNATGPVTGNLDVNVIGGTAGNDFINNAAAGIVANANAGALDLIVVGDNDIIDSFRGIAGGSSGALGSSDLDFLIDGAFINQEGSAGTGPAGIAFAAFDGVFGGVGEIEGAIRNSTVTSSTPISGAGGTAVLGISLINEGSGENNLLLDNNTITLNDGFGVVGNAQGSGTGSIDLTVTRNTVDILGNGAGGGDVANTALSFDNSSINGSQDITIDVSGNTLNTSPGANFDIVIDKSAGSATFVVAQLTMNDNTVPDFGPNNQDVERDLSDAQTNPVETAVNPFSETGFTTGIATVPVELVVPLTAGFTPPGVAGAAPAAAVDDPAPAVGGAEGGGGGADPALQGTAGSAPQLGATSLAALAAEARGRWEAAGLTEHQRAALDATEIAVADLDGLHIGAARAGLIEIDTDAAGNGWFIDPTPFEDTEFETALSDTRLTDTDGPAAGRMDLLSVLMHEMGHVIGLTDLYAPGDADDLMAPVLFLGERKLPEAWQSAGAVPGSVGETAFIGAPINIGLLPAGESVTITFEATVDTPQPGLLETFSQQGTVSFTGAAPASIQTDDPDVAVTAADPTVTVLDSLTLGGTVFLDTDASGTLTGMEGGVTGVSVQLYVDDGTTAGVLDAGDTNIAGTSSAATTGDYAFTGLAPGDYIVELQGSGLSSTPGAVDPDNDVDGDDNGDPVAGFEIASQAITLAFNSEPPANGDTNLTLDFALIANTAPVIGDVDGETSTVLVGLGARNVPLLDDATVADADSADFNGGMLSIVQTSGTANGSWSFDGPVLSGGDGTIAAGETVTVSGSAVGTIDPLGDGQAGNALTIGFDTANATPATVQTLLRSLSYTSAGPLDMRGFTVAVQDGDGTTAGGTDTGSAAFTLDIEDNLPPSVSGLPGDMVSFVEGSSAVMLDAGQDAAPTDPDSPNFDGGALTVALGVGSDRTEDVLDTEGGVSYSGTPGTPLDVTVDGVVIGTRLQFGVGEDIVFDFNANATLARVQTLLRALSFDNIDDDDPTPGGRMIDYTLTDGDGGTATFSSTVTVEAVDDTPTIGALDGDVLAYAEGDGLVAIDAGANAAVLDVDGSATAGPGDFGTGQLTLAISAGGEAAEDTLSILPSGPLTFDDTTGALGFGGTAFGTATGGTSGSPLVIALTAEADVAMVDALLRAVAYRNTDEDSPVAGDRTVDFSLVNGLTQVPNTVSATVSVSARNDFPSITDFTLATLNYAEGQGPLFLDIGAPAMVTDVDSPDFDGGLLRLAINAGGDAGEDILAIDEGAGVTLAGDGVLVDGIEIGTVTGGTGGLALSIALDEDATAATVARVIQRLTYENTDTDDPTGGARAVLLSISDGDVDPSGTRNLGFEIDVLPVDDPPEILELDGDVVPYVEGDGPVAVDRGTMLDIVDVDSDHFDGGTLRIALSDPSPLPDGDLETLGIRTANGVATPMPGVGNPLVVDGLAIGTIAAVGQLGAGTFFSLDVALNANATPERVARVLRELTYENAAAADLDEGARTLTVQLRDTATGPFATAEVTIDVADRPEPPVARDDAATVSEDGPETAVDVLANDSDANGDPLTLSAIAANGFAGTARIGAGGTILYDPAGAFEALAVGETAEDLINYTISDGTGRSGTAALRVTVEGANDAPVANNDIARVEAGPDEVAIAVLDNDSDVDASDQLTVVRLDTIDTDGTARILADGQTVIYVPDPALAPGSAAIDRLVYEVSDGNGGLATASITVLIGNAMPDPGPGPGPAPGPGPGPTGSPPVARDDAFGTGARQALSGKVLADNGAGADSDPDGGALTVNALAMPVGAPGMPVTLASGAVVTLSADGGFLYDPAGAFDDLMPGDTATDSFDYSVVDDDGLTDTATVSIDIAGPQFTVLIGTPAPDRFDIDSFGTPVRIEGLAEEDTVALPATLAEIDIEAVEGGFRIRAEDGQPIDLISVERIELADTTLVLCDTPEAATLFLLYQLILDRAPDPSGLAFWKASIAAGASFEFVAGKMIESDEFLDNFGVPESDAAFVEDRYLFGLERMPDMAGFDFWTGLLETGALSQAGMAVASSRSPELIEFYEAELANGWLAEEPTIL